MIKFRVFVIDISMTNDINDQNQLYVMAKDAVELLTTEAVTVIADTGYYNVTEIKNCVDDGMNVYIKKQKPITAPKTMNFAKRSFRITRSKTYIFVQLVMSCLFSKILLKMG